MPSVFSKIIAGEIPAYKVMENDRFLALLDINPVQRGHVLVIPKVEVDYLFDLEDDTLSEMMIFAKLVSKKMKFAIPCNRIGVTVIGLEVPHAHIHLIPINSLHDMDFTREKLQLTAAELAQIAKKIAEA